MDSGLNPQTFPESARRKISPRMLGMLALACGLACVAVLQLDAGISASSRELDVPGDVEKAIQLSEAFGHSSGAAAILLSLYWIAIDHRRRLAGAILLTLAAGLTANLLKASVPRVRPHSVESMQGERGSQTEVRFWDSRQRSFPSGHAATAWGLALGLAFVFPRGAGLFAFFACLASFQRVYSGAHYLSDVLAGAAIAFAWGAILLTLAKRNRVLASWFDACSVAPGKTDAPVQTDAPQADPRVHA